MPPARHSRLRRAVELQQAGPATLPPIQCSHPGDQIQDNCDPVGDPHHTVRVIQGGEQRSKHERPQAALVTIVRRHFATVKTNAVHRTAIEPIRNIHDSDAAIPLIHLPRRSPAIPRQRSDGFPGVLPPPQQEQQPRQTEPEQPGAIEGARYHGGTLPPGANHGERFNFAPAAHPVVTSIRPMTSKLVAGRPGPHCRPRGCAAPWFPARRVLPETTAKSLTGSIPVGTTP